MIPCKYVSAPIHTHSHMYTHGQPIYMYTPITISRAQTSRSGSSGDACVDLNVSDCGGARGVMVIVVGNGHGGRLQFLDETDCISHSTNTLGKGMNPIILPPTMGK